jgi:hypothetical protein
MNNRKIWLLVVIATLALSILACGVSASTANIKSAAMAKDEAGSQPSTTFAPEDTFYCVVELANAPDDTKVKASWTAVEVEGADPNTFLDQAELTTGSDTLHFNLTNNGPWPVGKYKVDLYLNDTLDRTLEFRVE